MIPARWYNTRRLIPALVLMWFLIDWGMAHAAEEPLWWHADPQGNHTVELYFFWTATCPHCQRAKPDIAQLAQELPWLVLHSLPLSNPTNGRRYAQLARATGGHPQSVPAFIFCGQMLTGYDSREGIGQTLREGLLACKSQLDQGLTFPPDASAEKVKTLIPGTKKVKTLIPGIGQVDMTTWSLPVVAVTLGLLDSFNPCAFFVLLFLLSLLVNANSRRRMLIIGGLFVAISGGVYFLFMAAWLNLFLLIGQLTWITFAAGLLALFFGVLNIKDFFVLHRGPSLSISAQAKPTLFKRMRSLVSAEHMGPMLMGTAALAVVANSYELLCTAGFPMVFTRMLTLQGLPVATYYGYLGLYCLVYVIPLLAIVSVFAWTLGRHKLSEHEGRTLKLMSGLMMTGLGLILITAPEYLNHIGYTAGLLGVVVGTTLILHRWTRASAAKN